MLQVIDLMEIYRIRNSKTNNLDLFTDIMNNAELDQRIDRETLALVLLGECGSMMPRWEVTDIFFSMGLTFFRSHKIEIAKKLNIIFTEYDPLKSIDVTKVKQDSYSDTQNNDMTRTDNLTATRTDNLTDTRTDNLTESSTNTTSTRAVSADNESGFQNREQTTDINPTITNTGTQTNVNTGTQTNTNTGTRSTESELNKNGWSHNEENESGRRESAQDLIKKQLEIACYNIYEDIAIQFSEFMCVGVY